MHASTVLAADPPRAAPAAPAAAPTPPVSQPTPDQLQAARELFSAASKDEGASRWSDALEKLHRVADVKLTAGVRYHIAFCEEKLGQTATALAHFAEARDAAEREHNKEVLDLLKEPFLSDLHARVPTLSIDVPSDAKDAVVTIDDHPHPSGLWGVAVPVDPGTHRIDAHAAGRAPFSKELTLHEREVTVLDVVLPPSSPAPTPTPTSTSTPTPTSTPTSTSTTTSTSSTSTYDIFLIKMSYQFVLFPCHITSRKYPQSPISISLNHHGHPQFQPANLDTVPGDGNLDHIVHGLPGPRVIPG